MRSVLSSRVCRLEQRGLRTAADTPFKLRLGHLKNLPPDYTGERHIVIANRLPSTSEGREWCEFEERPGPAPPGALDEAHIMTVYFIGPERCVDNLSEAQNGP
jgi:hypothetical protein